MRLLGKRRIYVASSWRNLLQPGVVAALRSMGHEVYDFKNPRPGDNGFHWSDIDPRWQGWTPEAFATALHNPIATAGFTSDFGAMQWADTGVLVLPSGRSAHIEAGYFVGAGKPLLILLPPDEQLEPELMYRMADAVVVGLSGLLERFELVEREAGA
jgi:hypothetical protein